MPRGPQVSKQPLFYCTQERRGRAKQAGDSPHRGSTSCRPLTEQMRELTKKIKQLMQNLALLDINMTAVTHHKLGMKA